MLSKIMFISKSYTYALVGASDNREKYGNIVLRDFLDNGYYIIPVNPNDDDGTIEGLQTYGAITEIDEPLDVVIFVVPPEIVLERLPNVIKKGVHKVRFQPGAESEDAIRFCKEHGIKHNKPGSCIIMERDIKRV